MTRDDRTGTDVDDSLDRHQQQLDRIDQTIVALLNERLRTGIASGALSGARPGTRAGTPAVLARVRHAARGPLPPASAERIFTAILAEMTPPEGLGHDE